MVKYHIVQTKNGWIVILGEMSSLVYIDPGLRDSYTFHSERALSRFLREQFAQERERRLKPVVVKKSA